MRLLVKFLFDISVHVSVWSMVRTVGVDGIVCEKM